jgi:hypothetical protein
MMEFELKLEPHQLALWNSPAQNRVGVFGRRSGKTYMAVRWLCLLGLTRNEAGNWPDGVGMYIAPTLQQAKNIAWDEFKSFLSVVDPGATFLENTAEIRLTNGKRILLLGSDRPDTLRGMELFGWVVDEMGDMKPDVVDAILLPAAAKQTAPGVIIGTPKGFNHFYDVAERAKTDEGWSYHHATMADNPHIPQKSLERLKNTMSSFLFQQEILAKFQVSSSELFDEKWIIERKDKPSDGVGYVAVDLAGFSNIEAANKATNPSTYLDSSAICPGYLHGNNRVWVPEIEYGRWGIHETAARIVKQCAKVQAHKLGIEKGVLFQAVEKDVREAMRTQNYNVRLEELTHGNRNKTERIVWAIQAKLEHGLITFAPGPYLRRFKDELLNIPNKGTHDDLPDSLSLLMQLMPMTALQGSMEELFYDYTLAEDPIGVYNASY